MTVLKIVIDTNIWIRALLAVRITIPVLEALHEGKFQLLISSPLLEELENVLQRPRLKQHIREKQAETLLEQLALEGNYGGFDFHPSTLS